MARASLIEGCILIYEEKGKILLPSFSNVNTQRFPANGSTSIGSVTGGVYPQSSRHGWLETSC